MGDERRIDDGRIGQILTHLEGMEKLFDAKMEPVSKMLAVHDRTLFGDGSENNQGLRVRVDRVEQDGKRRTWLLRAISAPVLAGIGMKIWDWIKHP